MLVAGDQEIPVRGRKPLQQLELREAGVLDLIGDHLVEASPQPLSQVGSVAEQPPQLEHEISGIQAPGIPQDRLVTGVELGELQLPPCGLSLALPSPIRRLALP